MSTLLNGLLSYWNFDEESTGNRFDIHRNRTLIAQNTPGFETAKIRNGAVMVRASNQSLASFDTVFDVLNTDFTISFWIKPASFTGDQHYLLKADGGGGSFAMEYTSTGSVNKFRWRLWNAAGFAGETAIIGNNVAAYTIGTWYHIVVWHDSVNDLAGMTVNGVAEPSSTHTNGCFGTANPFAFGSYAFAADVDGTFDEAGFWNRVLTKFEISKLYNNGYGLKYPLNFYRPQIVLVN